MNRERLEAWCERGIVGAVLALLLFGPLALGGVRPSEFLVLQGLTMLVMVLWLARLWINPRLHLLWPPVCWGVLAFAAYAVARYWFADLEYVARQEMVRVLLYATLFLACVNNVYHQNAVRILVYGLVLLGTVEGCLAIYQFHVRPTHIWGLLRPWGFIDRGSGTYICPNHLAGLLEMILPLTLAWTVASRARPLTKVFLGYGCVMMGVGIVVSMSRGGWAAAAFGLVLLLCLLVQTPRQWLALAAGVALLIGLGLLLFSKSVTLQLRVAEMRKGLDRLQHNTRYGLAVAAVKMWRDHPWFGVGPAHFDVRFRGYRAEHGLLQNRPGRAHNDYLNTLADWGTVGAALVALPLGLSAYSLGRHWGRLRRGRGEPSRQTGSVVSFVAGAAAGWGALLLHSAFDFNFHIPANAILAVVLLALLNTHLRFATDKYWVSASPLVRGTATLLLLGGLTFFLLVGLRAAEEDYWLRRARSLTPLSQERIAALQRAQAVEPRNAETANLVAEQYRHQSFLGEENYREEAAQAMDWFQRAARLNPYDPLSRLGMAACLDWLDRHDEAEPWYHKALALDPNGHRVRAQLGWHYYQREDYVKAFEWFEKARYLLPDTPVAGPYFKSAWDKMREQKQREALKQKPAPPPQ